MSLRLAVPSKGRLQADTFDWFGMRGITLRRIGSGREYAAAAEGIDGLILELLPASEIARDLASGRIHLGVTGTDLIREKIPDPEHDVRSLAPLGFGHADLVLAVPEPWVDVNTLDDLDDVASRFRRHHGHRLRIATKYHRLVREFLRDAGVADYALVDSQGATEGTVRNRTAEAIADITSTGETLKANRLKVLTDGLILQSQAELFLSCTANWSPEARAVLEQLADTLDLTLPELG